MGGGGSFSDQYGDSMRSQDRDAGHAGSHKSGGGGGSAGGGGAKGPKLTFQKQMPKFLQQYQHLLGGRGRGGGGDGDEDEPTVDDDEMSRKRPRHDEEDEEPARRDGVEDVEAEALRRAMLENPALAEEFEATLAKRIGESEAEAEKEKGNALFKRGSFVEAAECFSRCIEKSSSNNQVYYSNRSACYASLGSWPQALEDARAAVKLKPGWAKAYTRLGAAFTGLNLFSEAKEAFESAAKIEPDNVAIRNSLQQAMMSEMREVQANKHKFKAKTTRVEPSVTAPAAAATASVPLRGSDAKMQKDATSGPKAPIVKKALLSFDDEEDA